MAPEPETENVKRKVADHFWLNAAGEVVEDIEDATGIRYKDAASGKAFDYQAKPNTDSLRMFGLFGMRTLATNEASAARQKDGGSDDQLAAIAERFAFIDGTDGTGNGGKWVDRTREGGARWDLAVLATAAVNVLERIGKLTDDEAKGKAYERFLAQMTDYKAKVTTIRSVEGVEAEYKRLQGKTAKTADDLVSMLG